MSVLQSGQRNTWLTPPRVLERVRAYFDGPIPFDPATSSTNPTVALHYFTEADNGLGQPWPAPVFVNPPYSGGALRPWLAKIHEEALGGLEVLALLPCGARFSTKRWQAHVFVPELAAVCFLRGRVAFVDPATGQPAEHNTWDSAIYGFNVDLARFEEAFSPLGRCLSVTLLG